MKKLEGKITITAPHGANCDFIEIELTDKTSGCGLVEIQIPYATFTRALTGLAYQECNYIFHEGCPVGKVREVKTERVAKPEGYRDKEQGAALLAPFEIDGWQGRFDDLFNGHRGNRDGTQNVAFIRFVDAPEENPL